MPQLKVYNSIIRKSGKQTEQLRRQLELNDGHK